MPPAFGFYFDAVEAEADGDIEGVGVFADAEGDVAGEAGGFGGVEGLDGAGGEEGDFLAGGVDDEDAGALRGSRGDVDVAE